MTENKKSTVDTETLLFALNQISQTIGIISSVVDRLRDHVIERQHNELNTQNIHTSATSTKQTNKTNTIH